MNGVATGATLEERKNSHGWNPAGFYLSLDKGLEGIGGIRGGEARKRIDNPLRRVYGQVILGTEPLIEQIKGLLRGKALSPEIAERVLGSNLYRLLKNSLNEMA